jgi:hypothetical protein
MDWDTITLVTLAAFGFVGLLITLSIGLLRQLPELFRALRAAKNALRDQGDHE